MIIEKLRADMITAMKEKKNDVKTAISSLVDNAKKVVIDKGGDRNAIPDDIVTQVIMKEIKTIKEQIDSCPADRTELLEEFKKRLSIVSAYAPKMMSKDEIIALVKEKFSDIVSSKNKGLIMKNIMPVLKGKAEGSVINQIVEELCK